MQNDTSSLDGALSSLEDVDAVPMELPIAHLSAARYFGAIAEEGQLEPRQCKVFRESYLYFSYGGVFYRTSQFQTENASELPIAFLFDPMVLTNVTSCFPFDSGAIASGAFGEWSHRIAPIIDLFKVNTRNCHSKVPKLVYYLYQDNEHYLRGQPSDQCHGRPGPFPLLYEFLRCNLSHLGIDHRQRTIECLTQTAQLLHQGLIWIGLPDSLARDFFRVYQWTRPSVPEFFLYPYHQNFNPAHLGMVLEQEAHKVVRRFIRLPL